MFSGVCLLLPTTGCLLAIWMRVRASCSAECQFATLALPSPSLPTLSLSRFQLCLNIVLTCLGYVPGVLHACCIIGCENPDNYNRSYV